MEIDVKKTARHSNNSMNKIIADDWLKIKATTWFKKFKADSLASKLVTSKSFDEQVPKHYAMFLRKYHYELGDQLFDTAFYHDCYFDAKGTLQWVSKLANNIHATKWKFWNNFKNISNINFEFDEYYEQVKNLPLIEFDTNVIIELDQHANNNWIIDKDQRFFWWINQLTNQNKKVVFLNLSILYSRILGKNNFNSEPEDFKEIFNCDYLIIENMNLSNIKSWFTDTYLLSIFEHAIKLKPKIIATVLGDFDEFIHQFIKKSEISKGYLELLFTTFDKKTDFRKS